MDGRTDRQTDRQTDRFLKLPYLPSASNSPQSFGREHFNELTARIPEAQPTFPDLYDKDCH